MSQVTELVLRERVRVMTIAEATDLWLGELARRKRSRRTRESYRRYLDKLADTYPYADVAEVTPAMCRRFVDRWQNNSPRTIAVIVSTLTTFFGWLDTEDLLDGGRSPMERILRPRLPVEEEDDSIVSVTGSDVDKLFRATTDWTELLAIAIFAYLGPRRHAGAQLRLRDYDRDERTLTFHREKGSKTITKPCPDRLVDVLEGAITAGVYDSPDDYIIPGRAKQRRSGDRDDRVIWKIVRGVADRAGVDSHVHALRAAFATRFLETHPGELEALQGLMGHRQLSTTQKYLRRLNRRQAMERVRDLAWGDNPGFPQTAGTEIESLPEAEKEGFEPSIDADPHPSGQGTQREPLGALDQALQARIRAYDKHRHPPKADVETPQTGKRP